MFYVLKRNVENYSSEPIVSEIYFELVSNSKNRRLNFRGLLYIMQLTKALVSLTNEQKDKHQYNQEMP